MREVFARLGSEWNEIGKPFSDLNLILSAPIFRHQCDADVNRIAKVFRRASLDSSTMHHAVDMDDSQQNIDPFRKAIADNQANDETLLDAVKLMLLAVLYCKGSRLGKSNLLFPLLTRQPYR